MLDAGYWMLDAVSEPGARKEAHSSKPKIGEFLYSMLGVRCSMFIRRQMSAARGEKLSVISFGFSGAASVLSDPKRNFFPSSLRVGLLADLFRQVQRPAQHQQP